MDNTNNQTIPPPPPGFVPDAQVATGTNGSDTNIPPPPAGFVPDASTTQDDSSNPLHINRNDNVLTQGVEGLNAVGAGIGEGLLSTANGAANLLHLPHATLQSRENELHRENAENPILRSTGLGVEDLSEFILGDEALKGLSMSDRLLKASKLSKMIEESPTLNRIFQAGVRSIRGGAVAGTETGIKTNNLGDAVSAGVAAGAGAGVLPEVASVASKVPGAVRNVAGAVSDAVKGAEKIVQPELQGTIRSLLNDVAQEAGVQPSEAASLRDVAQETAAAIKAKASGIYKQLDKAIGGTRFQTYDEQLSNVRRTLRNSAGVNPDEDGRLVERINDLEDAKAKALEQAQAKGVDPKLINEANAAYRQGSALEDLSKHIRQSAVGLRPDLTETGSKAATESIAPAKLAPRVNRMYDSGRLHQALGEDRADDLLKAVESANQRTKGITANRKTLGTVGKRIATGVGIGAGGYEVGKHLFE